MKHMIPFAWRGHYHCSGTGRDTARADGGIMGKADILGNLKSVSWHDFFSVRSFGFALVRAWGFLTVFGVVPRLLGASSDGAGPGAFTTFASAAVLVASGCFPEKAGKAFDSSIGKVTVACLAPLGTIMAACGCAFGLQFVNAVGLLVSGIGSSLTLLYYGQIYGKRTTMQNAVEIPFSLLLAAVVYAILASLPAQHAVLDSSILPATSSIIAYTLSKPGNPPTGDAVKAVNVALFSRKLGVAVLLAGFADGIVRAGFFHVEHASVEWWVLNPCIWSCALSVCIIYPCVLFARRRDLRMAYRSVMFLTAAFFMLLPTLTHAPFLQDVIALSGYEVFTAFIWVFLARTTYEWNYSSMMVFGVGWGLVYLGNLLGIVGSELVRVAAPLSPELRSLVAFIAACCVLLSYFFVFDESDMTALSQRPKTKKGDRMPFKRACEEIAAESALSPRETEVFILAAKGRTLPKIQEELYIAQGTAATHMRHVYKKLGVHSKQELSDLVDGKMREAEGSKPADAAADNESERQAD